MLSKKDIQFIRSLKLKKYRQQYQTYIAEGEKWLQEIVKANYPVQHIYVTTANLLQKLGNTPQYKNKVTLISEKALKQISQLKTPNQALCLLKIPQLVLNEKLLKNNITIVCDNISDPGNMGTIIRTACWFGCTQIVCAPQCVDVYNSKVIQATMGTLLHVNALTIEPAHLFKQNTTLPIYAASLNGKPINEIKLTKNGFLIIGNESKGIRPQLLSQASHLIKIEGSGLAESLNASVAAGIMMYHFKHHNYSLVK